MLVTDNLLLGKITSSHVSKATDGEEQAGISPKIGFYGIAGVCRPSRQSIFADLKCGLNHRHAHEYFLTCLKTDHWELGVLSKFFIQCSG